jgi:hypothetical protein
MENRLVLRGHEGYAPPRSHLFISANDFVCILLFDEYRLTALLATRAIDLGGDR